MEIFKEAQRNDYSDEIDFSQLGIFIREFKQLGCEVERQGKFLKVTLDGEQCYLLETETSFTSLVAFRMLKSKTAARRFFRDVGVNHAKGYTYRYEDKPRALAKLDELGVVVVKPANGRKGAGVSVNVTKTLFDDAWESAAKYGDEIIVETCFQNGVEARYFVIDGKCVAVHSRMPPRVVGNGIDCIEALVEKQNQNRVRCNPTRKNAPILLDNHRIGLLRQRGLTPQSIPARDERIQIDWKAGISTGGDTENISDFVDVSMKQVAERIANAMPGLDVIGVDILAHDHRNAATIDNYVVIEANTRPGTRGHVFPDFGESINVCRLVAENCVRRMKAPHGQEPVLSEVPSRVTERVAGIACDRWSYNEFTYFHTALDHYDAVIFIDSRHLDIRKDPQGRTTGAFHKGYDLTRLCALYPFDDSAELSELIVYLESRGCRIATYPDAAGLDAETSLGNASQAWRLYIIDNDVVGGYEKVRRKNGKFRAQIMTSPSLRRLEALCSTIDLRRYQKGAYALDFVQTPDQSYRLVSATHKPRLPDFQRVTGKSFPDLVHQRLCGHLLAEDEAGRDVYCATFLGDTNPGETYQDKNEARGKENVLKTRGYDNGFRAFLPILKTSDHTVLNLEACITAKRDSELRDVKPYLDWTDVEQTPALLRELNVDAVCLANNHAYDFGADGLAETLDILRAINMVPFGAGLTEEDAAKPIHKHFQLGGSRHHLIVVTGFEYRKNHDGWAYYARHDRGGVNNWANKQAAEQLSRVRAEYPDAVIVAFPHWGSNYSYKSARQERLAKTIIDAGADLIIGHGSHMMQEIESYNGRLIVYGIGNFVFNSPGRYRKFPVDPFGLIAQLKFYMHRGALAACLDLYPTWIDNRDSDYNTDYVNKARLLQLIDRFFSHKRPDNWLVRNSILCRDRFGYRVRLHPKLH